ncbi:MAG: twin-arginine translocation signal domain-containing protein, partial [Verrucomicrobia bacterium]|nr:twin-arginine translocation signal domain-containing protein [Verrucomicrobiota bacterium]
MKRREFLRHSAAAAAVLGFPMIVAPDVLGATRRPGPNDRLQIGFVGLGGRARWILKNEALPGAELVAAADCYLTRINEAAQQVAGGDKWHKYQHYYDMLEKEKLDAVFVETTTHARVL